MYKKNIAKLQSVVLHVHEQKSILNVVKKLKLRTNQNEKKKLA